MRYARTVPDGRYNPIRSVNMTTPVVREEPGDLSCPACGGNMRREFDGVRNPPMPKVFWFCTKPECGDGKRNRLYSGG